MRILQIDYTRWKSITQTLSLSSFHKVIEQDTRHLWSGNTDYIFASDVEPGANFLDWGTAFPNSVSVPSEDEAISYIVVPSAP